MKEEEKTEFRKLFYEMCSDWVSKKILDYNYETLEKNSLLDILDLCCIASDVIQDVKKDVLCNVDNFDTSVLGALVKDKQVKSIENLLSLFEDGTSEEELKNSEELKLGACGVKEIPDGLVFIKPKKINLGDNNLGVNGVEALKVLSYIDTCEELKLYDNNLGGGGVDILKPLSKMTNLVSLDLASNNLAGHGLQLLELFEKLPNLQNVDLGENGLESWMDKFFEGLPKGCFLNLE